MSICLLSNTPNTIADTTRNARRGFVRQEKGQIGCVRYHTHDTCIWQIDMMRGIDRYGIFST